MFYCIVAVVCFAVGFAFRSLLGGISEKYLLLKAKDSYKTPICLSGSFYYIVEEREYLKIKTKAWRYDHEKKRKALS